MERIYVAVRARPLSLEEVKSSPWRISANSISNLNYSFVFDFDRIFGDEIKTREVYEARTKDIVEAAVHGFNGTVFAYGQTNSGKTHTMRGSTAEPGVIPLSIHDLFEIIQEDMGREFLLRMSYMEIYNEEINDLLAPAHRKLQIHESIERGIYVAGLREEIVASPEQVLEFMEFGESHRHIGETNMNLYSSRSHTIFRMIIESRERSENEDTSSSCDAVRVSVLNLVDLAGSERAAKTGAEGVRLKEGSHINKSLMTLGTVIKKLSEGAESQGGHVPYRDSKLTRILQPALGGNANTAIICNITLAQIHADETKSSLQFASRALRVTNCAHVNEILTDAALLKRQKKEIQELKAKLQGSHSEHFGEEILNLRNTLLQTELEKERIALELEEEKKTQAERERRLQEQAKKIENLSSIVLNSSRDDNIQQPRKGKRRDTWCFTTQPRETLKDLNTAIHAKASAVKSVKSKREVGPLLSFKELVNEEGTINLPKALHMHNSYTTVECKLPPPPLLHVTSRKKAGRNRSLLEDNNELKELRVAYEDLLLKSETERTVSEIKVDTLSRKLAKADSCLNMSHGEETKSSRDSEAILVIKQLQEKISILEMEKCSSDKKLDCVVELATEQNLCAMDKCDQLNKELLHACEEVKIAREQLSAAEYVKMGNIEPIMDLLSDVRDLASEVQISRDLYESVWLIVDEYSQSFLSILNLLSESKFLASQNLMQLKSISSDHEKLHNGLRHKISELENEKQLLQKQCLDLHGQLRERSLLVENSETRCTDLSERHEFEKSELLSHIQTLEKELSSLSSSSLAREKENLRKDLDKTRARLKETEFKLKSAIQEKTKLEGEKACSERELKKIHGQKALLERDLNKRESLAGRRRDSMIDRSSNMFDPKRGKGFAHSFDQIQEEHRKLEVLAFEMETTIDSLQSQLASATDEKEIAISCTKNLSSQLQAVSDELNMSRLELGKLQEESLLQSSSLEELKSYNHRMEDTVKLMVIEKDELAMQLTEALLTLEEEKAVWSAKEKASIEAIDAKSRTYTSEITVLSKEIKEVRDQLTSNREECEVLMKKLSCSKENSHQEEERSKEKYLEYEKLINDFKVSEDQRKSSQQDLVSKLQIVSSDHRRACEHIEQLKMELNVLDKGKEPLLLEIRESNQFLQNQLLMLINERDVLQSQIKEYRIHQMTVEPLNFRGKLLEANAEVEGPTDRLSIFEVQMHDNNVTQSKEKAKLLMKLRGTNAKMEAYCVRYKEQVQENNLMNSKFEEASKKLKAQLTIYAQETFNLRKQVSCLKKTVN